MILPSGLKFELNIHKSYKISSSDINTAIDGMSPIVVTVDQQEITRQLDTLHLGLIESTDMQWITVAVSYESSLLELQSMGQQQLHFICDETKEQQVELFGEEYTAREILCKDERLSTIQSLIISEEPSLRWMNQENYVYHMDYRRLLDWLAFDIGHASYDPQLYTNDYIDKLFGVEGLYFTSLGNKVDTLVPKDFAYELTDLLVDFGMLTMYTKKDGSTYNYFQHKVKRRNKNKVTYNDLLYLQNNYVTGILLSYIYQLSKHYGLALKLVGVGTGLLDIYVTGTAREYDFYRELSRGLKVRLFEMRSFRFIPNIERWVAGRRYI